MSNEDERERRTPATEWVTKLSRTSIDTDQLQAFFAWRRDPANRRVWDAMEAGRERVDRFVVRPETERFKVIDIWTGRRRSSPRPRSSTCPKKTRCIWPGCSIAV